MSTTTTPHGRTSVKVYITVFLGLMLLTVLTVGVSYFHLPVSIAIAIAVCIALVKGSLVAGYFMHLISEQKIIYITLLFTLIFLCGMMVLMILAHANQQGIN